MDTSWVGPSAKRGRKTNRQRIHLSNLAAEREDIHVDRESGLFRVFLYVRVNRKALQHLVFLRDSWMTAEVFQTFKGWKWCLPFVWYFVQGIITKINKGWDGIVIYKIDFLKRYQVHYFLSFTRHTWKNQAYLIETCLRCKRWWCVVNILVWVRNDISLKILNA